MNNYRPSEDRIAWTVASLNFTLDIQQSIQTLVNSKGNHPQKYQKNTIDDSLAIQEFKVQKLPGTCKSLASKREFQPFYWYQDNEPEESIACPSEQLNTGFFQVGHYIDQSMKHIHAEFTLSEVENDDKDEEVILDENDIEVMY